MPQIVTDIKKPETIRKPEIFFEKEDKKEIPQILKNKNDFRDEQKEKKPRKIKSSWSWLVPVILVLVFVLGLGVYSYFFSVGATVIIWPKKEPLAQDVQLTVDQQAKNVSLFTKTIPGTLFQEEKTISQDFQPSGKSMQGVKATGIVRIYNNYSTATQALVANTRLISSGGKLFRTAERVIVPGQSSVGGKLQPGSIDVKIVADQPGEEYNINASDFSIPGFAGTPKYTGFYGKSTDKMTGGYKGEVGQVTQKDIDAVKSLATQKISEETRSGLKGKINNDFIYLESAIRDKVLDVKTPKAGDTGKSFTIQIKGISEVLAFKKADLDDFVSQSILFQKAPEKTLYKESLKNDYALSSSQMDSGKIILDLKILVDTYTAIDENKIKETAAGVAPAQIKEIMSTDPTIDKIQIKLLPPWSNSVPKDKGKISVKINLGA